MFNAAWYSNPKVFEALRRKARLRRDSVGGGHGNFEQGNAFASRQRLKPVEKSQEKLQNRVPVFGPAFHRLCLEDDLSPGCEILRHTCDGNVCRDARVAMLVRSFGSFVFSDFESSRVAGTTNRISRIKYLWQATR